MDIKNEFKSEVGCVMCNMVLNDPITFPCDCLSCNEHLTDHFVKDNKIKCLKCNQEFSLANENFRTPHKSIKNIINKEFFLNEDEKILRKDIHELIDQVEKKIENCLVEKRNFELFNNDHFDNLRRLIDLRREVLKSDICEKIDEIALDMIEKTKEIEAKFNKSHNEIIIAKQDFEKERKSINEEFRKLNISMEHIQQLKVTQKENIKIIEAKLKNIKTLKEKIKLCSFKVISNSLNNSLFGKLNLNHKQKLISCSDDETIKSWDLETNECLKILNGHTASISCLERVSNDQIISCSRDKTIKLWNIDTGDCIKTFHGHSQSVLCLNMITEHTFATGSYKEIKLWDINQEFCIKTMTGHDNYIRALLMLPNGCLVSGSQDKSIKVWDIDQSMCIRTLNGHSDSINCLILLENGNLSSASADSTIKIWNLDTGNCNKTFTGHTSSVINLYLQESGELISCSKDKTIKIWNSMTGECLKTLNGHNNAVSCIKSYNNFLISSSHKTIKFWSLENGEVINSLEGHNDTISNLILI